MKGLHPQLTKIYEQNLQQPRTFEQLTANRAFTHFSLQPLDRTHCTIEEMMIGDIRTICLKPKQPYKNATCFIWFHGGGMVFGSPDDSITYLLDFVEQFQAVILIPQYRLAPEYPYPAAVDDGYVTLLWAHEHAQELNININQIILSGGSAGGNLALAVSLKARDFGGPTIAAILPLYPMLDWQVRPFHERFTSVAIWNHEKNQKSWNAYLKQCDTVPAYASPFYAKLNNLPPIYTFIGTLDLFYEEVCEFVEKLKQAQNTVYFDYYEGCFHGFDLENVPIAQQAKKQLLTMTRKILNESIS